jgi:uncharacterized protein involved in exopolysaccharide biosynthesis
VERTVAPVAEVVDLADIFRSLKNGWMTVAAFAAIGILAAIGVLLFVPPTFAGRASIVLKTGANASSGGSLSSAIGSLAEAAGGGAAVGGLLPVKPDIETEVDILQSRSLASEVVDSLRLQAQIAKPFGVPALNVFSGVALPGSFKKVTYAFAPVSGTSPRQYRFEADGDAGVATAGQPVKLAIGSVIVAPTAPERPFKVAFRDREDATTRVTDHLKFDKTKTDIAHFEYRGDDSLTAARVPNLLLDLYLLRRKGIDRGTNQKMAEFLAGKVDSVGSALTKAERALRAERETSGVVDPIVAGQADFENENRLRQRLTELQTQERTLQQLVDQIRSGTATPRQLASYPQYVGSAPINSIVTTLISLETERDALLGTVTEQDERVKALNTRVHALEAQLMPLAQTTLSALASERSQTQQRIDGIQKSLVGVPRAAEAYTRLEREVVDLGKIFAGLQVKLVDARLAAITEGGDVRPLDLAVPPKKRAFPKLSLTLAAGGGGGLFIGIIAAVLLGLVGGRMHDAQDVERRTGLPAIRLDRTAPLLVGGQPSRTVVVAPISQRAVASPVVARLIDTALSRSLNATILDLTNAEVAATNGSAGARLITTTSGASAFDANAAIRRLEESHDLVVVQLPGLATREAAAVLDSARPVLLVAPERRIERSSLRDAVDLLRRVGAPCAGVVLHGDDRRSLRA